MFLPCYIFFTHFEFAAKFIYRCISPDISSVFFHVYETIKYWRGISCRAKIQLLFYYCFYFQILKAGGLPCYNLDRRTADISHVFLSATTKEKKMYKSKKFEDLTISDDFMFGIVMRDPKYCKPFLETILNIKITRSWNKVLWSLSAPLIRSISAGMCILLKTAAWKIRICLLTMAHRKSF